MKTKSIFFPAVLLAVAALTGCYSCRICKTDKAVPSVQVIEDITPAESYLLIETNKGNPDFIVLDVRTPEEFEEERLAGAVNIDFYSEDFRSDIESLDRNKTYLVYCKKGMRSRSALDLMAETGFRKAYNMTDGFLGWKEQGFPTVK